MSAPAGPGTEPDAPAETMWAWEVTDPGPIDSHPLRLTERPVPTPGPGQVRVAIAVCGVCRTDLHLAEGDLRPHRPHTVPGHEAVGRVDALGPGCSKLVVGQRVGVAWLAATCGRCRYCKRDQENLCLEPCFTGWDIDGGFAPYTVAGEGYVYALPDRFDDESAAPLLCAGIIGYRALRRSRLPSGGRLGIYGFGASAHLTMQLALAEGATVHVLTRSADARALALELGATSAGDDGDEPPELLDAAILFAPVGTLVPVALASLDRGGTLAIAGIHLTDIPSLDYQEHLFQERTLCSVTANTRADGRQFIDTADRVHLRPTTRIYRFEDANQALSDLSHDRFTGAAVLCVAPEPASRRQLSSA